MPFPVRPLIDPNERPDFYTESGRSVRDRWSRSSITWTSPTGQVFPLTGDISGAKTGVVVEQGVKGLDSPEIDFHVDELPAMDGGMFRASRAKTREIMLPLFLWSPTRREMNKLRRDLLVGFRTRDKPGVLRITEHDGTSRHIECFYASGMEGDYSNAEAFTYYRYGLVLQAPDPYWYGDSVTDKFTILQDRINFFTGKANKFLGINLTPNIFDDQTTKLTVTGEIDSWPVWTIEGKWVTSFELTNKTLGKSIKLRHDFTQDGDTVIIDTRPGRKSVISKRAGNVWPGLGANPQLWAVPYGESDIEIKMSRPTARSDDDAELLADAGTPTAIVTLDYQPRYLGA